MSNFLDSKNEVARLRASGLDGTKIVYVKGPNRACLCVGLALDSEDLTVKAILFDVEDEYYFAAKPGSIEVQPDHTDLQLAQKRFAATMPYIRLSGAQNGASVPGFDRENDPSPYHVCGTTVQHYKGGVYTVLTSMGTMTADPWIVYMAHADGVWWLRPWSEFGDGRFTSHEASPLTLDEAGIERVPFNEEAS